MKTRSGFVSNSSTSSFCIFGVAVGDAANTNDVDLYKLEEDIKTARNSTTLQQREGQVTTWLVYENGLDEYYGAGLVGVYPNDLDWDQTLEQSAKEIVEELKKFGVKVDIDDVGFYTDQGYD